MRGFDDAVPGEHFLLAKNNEDFAGKVLYFLKNREVATYKSCLLARLVGGFNHVQTLGRFNELFVQLVPFLCHASTVNR